MLFQHIHLYKISFAFFILMAKLLRGDYRRGNDLGKIARDIVNELIDIEFKPKEIILYKGNDHSLDDKTLKHYKGLLETQLLFKKLPIPVYIRKPAKGDYSIDVSIYLGEAIE